MSELTALAPGLLALLVSVLSFIGWWSLIRLIKGFDEKFREIREDLKDFRERHPTREEMDAKFSGVHRRVDDLNRHLYRRWSEETVPE